jgi:cellulose synthase/poly-beta-1,6-N-acetylglucosamine synthase-like glycosyltransferase
MIDFYTTFFHFVFWGSFLLLFHSYVGYPLLMAWLSRKKELSAEPVLGDSELPEVAVLMSVYNEQDVLEETLSSILQSDYPQSKLRVWIGSDGSTDGTHGILQRYQDNYPNLRFEVFEGRNGKIRIINQIALAAGERFRDSSSAVLLLCDANVSWAPLTLRKMVSRIARGEAGLVAACIRDVKSRHEGIGDQEEAYVDQENLLKYREGVLWGKMMGAFGACYAMRASLFSLVPASHHVDDFYQTMMVIAQKEKAIVDLDAVCYESVSTEISEEFRRKQRIANGNFQNLRFFQRLFLPWNGGWSTCFAFWSHKGLRWIGPLLLIAMGGACLALSLVSPLFVVFTGGIVVGGIACLIDAMMARAGATKQFKPVRFLRYFLVMNFALLLGMVKFFQGGQNSVWEPTKRVVEKGRLTPRESSAKSVS